MRLSNQRILVISPEAWDGSHLSKHHYSLELAAKGNKVFFLEPPTTKNEIEAINDNLQVVRYQRSFRGLNQLPNWVRIPLMKMEWRKIKKLTNTNLDIIWSFDPFRFQDLNLLQDAYSVFHSVDLIKSPWDIYTARNADLVLVTNRKIMERYQGLPTKIHLIGHGLSDTFLNHPKESIKGSIITSSGRPSIGYSGNLLIDYLDRETLLHLVEVNPSYDFHFFGPYQKSNLSRSVHAQATAFVQRLKEAKNCILHGTVPSKQLWDYLSQMDVLLVCYDTKLFLDEVADPHKLLEYLSTGKTVVANYTIAYEHQPDLIEMTTANSQLCQLLRKVVQNINHYNNKERMSMRKKYASERSYEKKIEEIEHLMQLN